MADAAPATLTVTTQLTPAQQDEVVALVERAATHDGHRAVNDAGLLALRKNSSGDSTGDSIGEASRPGPIHVLAHGAGPGSAAALLGYAQAIWEDDGPVAALVVDPEHRRQGIGSALWRTLAERTAALSGDSLRVWATGNTPAAQALAASQGLRAIRTLLVLGRSLDGDLPPVEPPAGITIRIFRPTQPDDPDQSDESERPDKSDQSDDIDGWLQVNSRAFASHPEQGSMTRADFEQRMAEPWFDPAGLFLAVRSIQTDSAEHEEIIGFHWTKREPGAATGEVYVIGVDPTAGVRGLGTPLLGAGLRHLRDTGAAAVDLYVEADNVPALSLYRRYGFSPLTSDVMYAAPVNRTDGLG